MFVFLGGMRGWSGNIHSETLEKLAQNDRYWKVGLEAALIISPG